MSGQFSFLLQFQHNINTIRMNICHLPSTSNPLLKTSSFQEHSFLDSFLPFLTSPLCLKKAFWHWPFHQVLFLHHQFREERCETTSHLESIQRLLTSTSGCSATDSHTHLPPSTSLPSWKKQTDTGLLNLRLPPPSSFPLQIDQDNPRTAQRQSDWLLLHFPTRPPNQDKGNSSLASQRQHHNKEISCQDYS
jgi:hypothetical protein